jgi:hypothetical protein
MQVLAYYGGKYLCNFAGLHAANLHIFFEYQAFRSKKFFFFSLDVRYWYMGIAVEMGAEATF